MNNKKVKQSQAATSIAHKNIPFHSLSPISDKEKHKYYCDALEWALTNRKEKDIKNIALTGTYGSGKSSILKTFQEREVKGLSFLKISLATFKEEKNKTAKISENLAQDSTDISDEGFLTEHSEETNSKSRTIPQHRNDQLRLIELSILQQIFYHEENDKIPDSRFKKIRSLKPNEIKTATWVVYGLISSFYLFFYFDTFRVMFNLPEPKVWFEYLTKGLFLTGFMILFYFSLKRVIQFSQKLTISKLNFQNLEIQVSQSIDKSILNDHLDEILYFFEATEYNVVIIEDLDRFEQTEIFTKLREINLLINNSKAIDRTVTFIYAVRDEMFKDNDRTKFFDFIIPVIPVINYSNSNEQLSLALEKFGYSLSVELIDEVAFYLDDMRLLYNIVNEFHIYFQKFKGKKYRNKLFAMMVYKNIYPEDFVRLGQNKGLLYRNIIENKGVWLKETITKIEKEDFKLKTELEKLERIFINDLDELKRIYLMEYIKKVSNLSYFRIENTNFTIEKMLEDENFEKLKSGSISYRDNQYNREFGFQFSDVESRVDPDKTYLERKIEIEGKNSGRSEDIRNKLKSNEEEKRKVRNSKIKYLLRDKKISLSSKPSKQEQLIILLIRNGYIGEDYLNYISYFYPGSITEKDHWFLMNVRNESESEFDYELDEVNNVIKKISDSEFGKSYVLNYNLLDNFLESGKFILKKDIFLKQLSNESDDSVKFIYSYIKVGQNTGLFIKNLCASWINIWRFIEQDITLSEEEKFAYLSLILSNGEIDDIEKIASASQLEAAMNQNSDFLSIIDDSKKLIEIIDQFDLKFTALKFEGSPEELRDYIYSMNNYAINPYMLKIMIGEFGEYWEGLFNESNYAAIQLSGCEPLIEYVNKNIEKYINSVYLKLNDNYQEKQEYLIELLNNPDIKKKSKEKIIIQTETLVNSLADLEQAEELSDFLIENSMIEPTWENMIFDYKEKKNLFSEILTAFINKPKNAETLIKDIISKEKQFSNFRSAFLLNNEILDELYVSYLKVFPFTYKEISFENLSKKKVAALVDQNKLSFNSENYEKLKLNFAPLNLTFIILNISEFFKIYSEITLSERDLSYLLSNSKLVDSHKINLIEKFEAENTIAEIETLTLIGKIALKYTKLNLSDSTISSLLLKSSLNPSEKIELYINNLTALNGAFITPFLNALGGDYKQLNSKGPMPYFKKSEHLSKFFEYLKQEGKISKIKEKKELIQVTTFRK